MEALKSLMRLVSDLAFTVLDGIDQMLASGPGARVSDDDGSAAAATREAEHLPFINPATGVRMRDGMGGVDALGHFWGSRE